MQLVQDCTPLRVVIVYSNTVTLKLKKMHQCKPVMLGKNRGFLLFDITEIKKRKVHAVAH